MSLSSPHANLYNALVEKLKVAVPAIRYIEQDLSQLEHYEIRPAVSWPCCLIDLEEFNFSNAGGVNNQLVEGIITLRIGLVKYTDSNNLVPENIRENALQFFEIEELVYKALHAWAPNGFSKLTRLVSATEKRDDDIRVRILKFAISYTDTSAKPVRTISATPNPTIAVEN